MALNDRQKDLAWWIGLAASATLITIVLFVALAWISTGAGA